MPEFTKFFNFKKKKVVAQYSSSTKKLFLTNQLKGRVEETGNNALFQLLQPDLPTFSSLYTYEKTSFHNKTIQYYCKHTATPEIRTTFLTFLDEALDLVPRIKNTDPTSFATSASVNPDIKYFNGRQINLLLKKTSHGKVYAIKVYQISFQNIINHIFCAEILKISQQKQMLLWNELAPYPVVPEIVMCGVAQWLAYSLTFCIMEWVDGNSLEILQSRGVTFHMAHILKNLSALEIGADPFLKNWIMTGKGFYYVDIFVPHGIAYKSAYAWDPKLIE